MESNEKNENTATFVAKFMNRVRLTYSHMLKEYLVVCKSFDQLRTNAKDEKGREYAIQIGIKYYDENHKINWEIIRRFMPHNMENLIKKEFNMLNRNEIRLCCLLVCKISNKMISKILPYNPQSIRSIIYKIKQKTNLNDFNEMFEKIIENIA